MFVALGFYMIVVILILMRPVEKSNILKSIHRLKQLERNIAMSTEEKVDVTGYAVHIGKRYVRPPLSIREIESELIDIIRDLSREVKIIFIFNELDKISDTEEEFNNAINYQRKKHVERLLGSLKNLVTTSQAQYIFIAGREVLDDYYGEHVSRSPLYESLFTNTFYVQSLLKDNSDGDSVRLSSITEAFVSRKPTTKESTNE